MERKMIGVGLVSILLLGICANLWAQNEYVPLQSVGSKFGPELNWIRNSQSLMKEPKTSLLTNLLNSQKKQEFGKAPAGTGAIRGRVTTATGGNPISNVVITARQLTCPYHNFLDTTGSDGYYLINSLPCGKYSLRTSLDSIFVNVYWNDKYLWETPDTLTVASNDTTENINFSLRVGGRITGTITLPGSLLIWLTFVFAIDTSRGMMYYDMPLGVLGTASYSIEGLPTGVYKLRSFNLLGYIDVYYNNKTSLVTADPISVTEGGTTSSKNFTLSSGGKIQGNVTSVATGPLDSALVLGILLQDTLEWFQVAFTNASGDYSLAGLRSGYWKIFALGDTTNAFEFYNNRDNWVSADSILVTSPNTVPGINFSLEVGGSISGYVYDLDGNPIPDCNVAVYESSLVQLLLQEGLPMLSQTGFSFRQNTTSTDGSYKITGLRTGDYYVKATTDCNNQWYDHQDSLVQGDLVHVAMPNNAPGIDFNLPSAYIRGDANSDGIIDVGDVLHIINYLFKNGPVPDPQEAGDANCDGVINVGDVLSLINYLFKGGPPPCC